MHKLNSDKTKAKHSVIAPLLDDHVMYLKFTFQCSSLKHNYCLYNKIIQKLQDSFLPDKYTVYHGTKIHVLRLWLLVFISSCV